MADFYYRHFEENDVICVKGRLDTNGEEIVN